jgi:cation diffusion facilitator CzcD-associated flavoprotein CzcO
MNNNHVDWAILGGGKNGVNLAAALTQKGIPTDKIKIIDRQAEPLQLWFEMTQQVGMEHLRSPINQHLDSHDSHDSLETFCDTYTRSQPDPRHHLTIPRTLTNGSRSKYLTPI